MGHANEELSKVLKRLGYPEIQDAAKPSSMIDKAKGACHKRMKKLAEYLPVGPNGKILMPSTSAANDSTNMQKSLEERPCPQESLVCPVMLLMEEILRHWGLK